MSSEKVREDQFRRQLARRGLQLQKSRARDPNSLTYGGYHIVDPRTNSMVAGSGAVGYGYAFDLDDVGHWLVENARHRSLQK